MGAYGLSIGAGKMWRDTSTHYFNKSAFIWYLNRALQAVGMRPIKALWGAGYDLDDPAMNGAAYPLGQYVFMYDYPCDDTFSINGVPYRPCIGLSFGMCRQSDGYGYFTDGQWQASTIPHVALTHCRRRADRVNPADVMNWGRMHVDNTNWGMGRLQYYWYYYNNVFSGREGSWFVKGQWQQHTGHNLAPNAYLEGLSVNHFMVALNKGGLLIQCGTSNQRKREQNDWFNCMFAFHGGRIPGRDLPTNQDVGIGRIDPVSVFSGRSDSRSGEDDYTEADPRYSPRRRRTYALGIQHDAKYTTQAVKMRIENLDSWDDSVITAWGEGDGTLVRNSPRAMLGAGYHVLNRAFGYTWDRYNTETAGNGDYYGPINMNIRPQPQPRWSDCWYYHGFRFGDQFAPGGEIVDVTENRHWWMFAFGHQSYQASQQMYAFDVEGIVKSTGTVPPDPVAPPAPVLDREVYVNFTNGLNGPWTDVTTDYTVSDASCYWQTAAGQDELQWVRTYVWAAQPVAAFNVANMQLVGPNDFIEIAFDMRSDNVSWPTLYNYMQWYNEDGAVSQWETKWQIQDSAHNGAWASYVLRLNLKPRPSGVFSVRFSHDASGYSWGATTYAMRIRNLKFRRYTVG